MDNGSAGAQADLEKLLGSALERAKARLAEDGEFLPFSLGLQLDGTIFDFDLGREDLASLPAADVLVLTKDALRRFRDSLLGVAIVIDFKFPGDDADDVRVRLEHSEGDAIATALPYVRSGFGGEYTYGELRTTAIPAEIWF